MFRKQIACMMKNVLIINGSPRKKGNTALMGDYLIQYAQKVGFSTEKIYLYDYKFEACIDCRACKTGKLLCTVKDDMQQLFPKIDQADILVFSTPIYWLAPTGKMKSFIDRLRPYFGNKKLRDKLAIILMAAHSGSEDSDLTEEMFRRSFDFLEINNVGSVTAKAYDIGDVAAQKNIKEKILKLVERLNA